MSTLKADTIQNTSGGAATLTKQSAAKAFMHYDASTNTIDDSLNISTVRDNATGDFDIVVTNNYGNATPSLTLATGWSTFTGHSQKSETTSSETRIQVINSSTVAKDRDQNMYTGHGDLA
jgi:hypothetical protein